MKNCFKITVVVVLICSIALAVSSAVLVKASKHTNNFTVVIDAGHGGIDGGASGINTGARESDINLLISKIKTNIIYFLIYFKYISPLIYYSILNLIKKDR